MKAINKPFLSAVIVLLLLGNGLKAQSEWEVDPLDFQYTMTVTGLGLYNCEALSDPNDMVAAFIDGECRGVAHFNTDINGKMMAYLTVYGNNPGGEQISFKLYNASTNSIETTVFGLPFSDGSIAGNAESPFKFQNQYSLSDIYLPKDSLLDYYLQGTEVSEMFVINEIGDTLTAVFDFVDDTLGLDNQSFSILNPFLLLDEDISYADKKEYTIHLSATSEEGCTVDKVLVLPVFNTNIPPLGLRVDTFFINENLPINTFVGTLEADDVTQYDDHIFTFFEWEEPNPDFNSFAIDTDELLTDAELNYEKQNVYHLAIEITDLSGNSVVDTLVVNVLDVIEFESLKSSNLITPNRDGFNDFFEIPNVYLFENYELSIYNSIGNRVFEMRAYDNSWHGNTNAGVALPSGTYYYVFQDVDNVDNSFEGEIHLYNENKF